MYVLNFIAMIFAGVVGILHAINGNIGWTLVQIGCVLMNLPFVIMWFKNMDK